MKRNWVSGIMKRCLFHYSQCLNTNVADKGLKSVYQENGKNHHFPFYCFIRKFHTLALLPPTLVPLAFNILAKMYKEHTPVKHQQNCLKWIEYYKRQWLRSGHFIMSWNCYKSTIRTNNLLESRNALMNDSFGSHPYLFKFVYDLAEWFASGFIVYEQYIEHGIGNKKHTKEVLKEKVLNKWWGFIAKQQTRDDILLFLEQTSIALRAGEKTLQNML